MNQISKNKKRVGRGIGSGKGKTCGRGTKGQKSRSGYNLSAKLYRGNIYQTPKFKGFKSLTTKPVGISTSIINKFFSADDLISPKTLIEKKIIKHIPINGIKIIGKIDKSKYRFHQVLFSKQKNA